ncbi:DUF2236 domain-containing protein [Pedobacter sp. HMF7647]|uniref:DUF2236 domain-containing protein n=1 Tax=Hufsiella arboris TaxID=2695275 RepID=A0A7K1YB54_9SPHI|nr:oxygenase MpaB family protein [Hufsiella arboris]MXV51827.1 DUF2236 domain-containing protein [Hufsiella arboris]
MNRNFFVNENSIVRQVWSKADTILFIFAGAAAEFALNKAVDWLYFTGKLPADPIGRLFSTVAYAKKIIFSPYEDALASIDQITFIHKHVEQSRGKSIPDWAYRDVLFMLIDYSIRSYELLERKLTDEQKEEIFATFHDVGIRMQVKDLPENFQAWKFARDNHLQTNLALSDYSIHLFKQYKKHLGTARYLLLRLVQATLCPEIVQKKLSLGNGTLLLPLLRIYRILNNLQLQKQVRDCLLPAQYKKQFKNLDIAEQPFHQSRKCPFSIPKPLFS